MTEDESNAGVFESGASSNGERMFSGPGFVASVERSLIRAAKQAHLIAYQHGTGVVSTRNGVPGVYRPNPAMYEDLIPPDFDRSSVPPQFEDERTFPDLPESLPEELLGEATERAKSS